MTTWILVAVLLLNRDNKIQHSAFYMDNFISKAECIEYGEGYKEVMETGGKNSVNYTCSEAKVRKNDE